MLIVRLVKLLLNYFSSSSKPTIDDLKKQGQKYANKYKDVEEADFKEINPEDEQKEDKN